MTLSIGAVEPNLVTRKQWYLLTFLTGFYDTWYGHEPQVAHKQFDLLVPAPRFGYQVGPYRPLLRTSAHDDRRQVLWERSSCKI